MKKNVAILLAVKQWRPYLRLGEFVIATDEKSFSYLNEQRLHHTQQQQKVYTKLLGLQYKIVYKKGMENKVADGLSKRLCVSSLYGFDVEVVNCYALSSCQPR
jgi:hypothetical protein